MIRFFVPILMASTLFGQSAIHAYVSPKACSSSAGGENQLSDPPEQQQAPTQQVQPSSAPAALRDVSFSIKSFARNFFSDQKKIWTFPAKLATGHELVPVLAITGVTAAIVVGVDPTEGKYFRTHASTFSGFNNTFSEHRTTASTLLIPAGLAGVGLITKHSYLAHTGLLALEAWVDVDITAEVMRNIADRRRPLDVPLNGNYSNTWFKTASSPLHADGSFPSGHTGWGFAVATTIARRYPHRAWVQYLAYGLATVDLASRLTSSNHFASDAVFGGILGYAIGRFVVVRQ